MYLKYRNKRSKTRSYLMITVATLPLGNQVLEHFFRPQLIKQFPQRHRRGDRIPPIPSDSGKVSTKSGGRV